MIDFVMRRKVCALNLQLLEDLLPSHNQHSRFLMLGSISGAETALEGEDLAHENLFGFDYVIYTHAVYQEYSQNFFDSDILANWSQYLCRDG